MAEAVIPGHAGGADPGVLARGFAAACGKGGKMRTLAKTESAVGIWMDEKPLPQPGYNEVLIRMKKTAICGTDIAIYNWGPWAQATIPVGMTVNLSEALCDFFRQAARGARSAGHAAGGARSAHLRPAARRTRSLGPAGPRARCRKRMGHDYL